VPQFLHSKDEKKTQSGRKEGKSKSRTQMACHQADQDVKFSPCGILMKALL